MALQVRDLERLREERLEEYSGQPDTRAFEQTYDRYRARLFRFCYSKLGDAHEAEDVTQEAFARAWRTQLSFAEEGRAYAWLRVVAGNLCTDLLRRRGRCQPAADLEAGTCDAADGPVLRAGDAQMVRQALARLNDRHRAALEQRESAGWTYEQMASHSGTTIASIESLLWRARQALKRELSALAGPDGLLAGLPVIGLAVRKFHGSRAKLAGWLSHWGMPQLSTGAAMVLGSCAAVCVSGLSGLPGPAAPAAGAQVAWVAAESATSVAPAAVTPAGPGATSSPTPAPTGPAPVGTAVTPAHSHIRLENPVTGTGADNRRDRSMPVSTGIGPDSVGTNPGAIVNYATGLVASRAPGNLGGQP